jgi:cold shock CspA family protein
MTGTIRTLNADRGFGFIRGEDGNEYFFHRSELRGGLNFEQLRQGQRVSFQPRESDKGPRAADIDAAAA